MAPKISTSPVFLTSLLLLLLHFRTTIADPLYQTCGKTGNYTANSTYQSNLNLLFSSLTSNNATLSGYYTATQGQSPDQISGLILCRGDTNSTGCLSCLATAIQDAPQLCPYTKAATIWYDECFLRYSNQHFLSSTGDDTFKVLMYNTQNITDQRGKFDELEKELLGNISDWAAYNSSKMFATGEVAFSAAYPKIYGLAQCVRNLTGAQCAECLKECEDTIVKRMPGAQGGRVLGDWCNLRYEVYSFYYGTSTLQLPSADQTRNIVPSGSEGKNVTGIVLAIVIPLVTALAVATVICICFWRRRRVLKIPKETNPEEITSVESILFDLATLRAATTNFSDMNKLGEGGFGAVYKGMLPDGREIAVKRLSTSSGQGFGELKNELVLVAKLQHRNLVRLLGVCLEEQEKMLVYEYVPNRSLDTILFDPTRCGQLDWGRRYKIISGIARGLLYLHEDSQLKIIHRDLKASNILLDSDMNPKISDFGLARLFGGDQTQGTTSRVVGTFGYMAPEYAMHGQFSIKSDVFSFGILVLEIVTGKKNCGFFDSEHAEDLLNDIWEHWIRGTISEMIDPSLGDHVPRSEALRCIQIGLLCVQENPADRPNMSTVVVMLDSYSVSLHAPSRPAFCVGKTGMDSDVLSRDYELRRGTADRSSSKSIPMSPNEVTVSELEPR